MKLFDATLTTLEHALDARLVRQNVLAGNLANANTPGFVPREVDFEAAMSEAARERAERGTAAPLGSAPLAGSPADARSAAATSDIPLESAAATASVARASLVGASPAGTGAGALLRPVAVGSSVVAAAGAAPGLDGNAVDVDRTLAAVAENALQYGASARAAGKKLAILRYAASDGAA
jgi:flagellar basal-body rod protein FlgB